ncbi:hypothetical protein QNH47_16180 [Virgibacillus halodenitrificans]|uniref:hypothetical protein n=1 Tax=Virgibacillus halodenitrificans TaxID=1482 RepID=UPI0024C0CA37|nr:hypothetical protein [Virgibacillus halodenitrificans]WHX25651.1 hypothetical protein QNH47_16180 [Virgibacillus halodenitrificans]
MNENFDRLLDEKIPLLIPVEIMEDYNDVTNENLRAKTRATSLRRCLEGSVQLFYREKMINLGCVTKEEWDKKSLFKHIELIGKHIDNNIAIKFNKVRLVGNAGGHFNSTVEHSQINNLIAVINEILEDLIVKYFEEYKFGSQNGVLTILSSLPPIHRVKILEKVQDNDKSNIILIEKLSMAYLKNGNFENSIFFLTKVFDEKIITKYQHSILVEKIELLHKSLDKFDISKNILDTARIFNQLSRIGVAAEYEEFMHIFSVLVNGYSEEGAN